VAAIGALPPPPCAMHMHGGGAAAGRGLRGAAAGGDRRPVTLFGIYVIVPCGLCACSDTCDILRSRIIALSFVVLVCAAVRRHSHTHSGTSHSSPTRNRTSHYETKGGAAPRHTPPQAAGAPGRRRAARTPPAGSAQRAAQRGSEAADRQTTTPHHRADHGGAGRPKSRGAPSA
jgi:hypothetical protein